MKLEINTGLLTCLTLNSCSLSTREPLLWLDNHTTFSQSTHSPAFLSDYFVPLFLSSNIKEFLLCPHPHFTEEIETIRWEAPWDLTPTPTTSLNLGQVTLLSSLLLQEHPFCQERPIPALVYLVLSSSAAQKKNCSRNFLSLPSTESAPNIYWIFFISIQLTKEKNCLLIHYPRQPLPYFSPFLYSKTSVYTRNPHVLSSHSLPTSRQVSFSPLGVDKTLVKVMNDLCVLNPMVKPQSLFSTCSISNICSTHSFPSSWSPSFP